MEWFQGVKLTFMKLSLSITEKATGNTVVVPAREWLNPDGSYYTACPLKPKSFNQAFTLLIDLLEHGEAQILDYHIDLCPCQP